MDHDQLAALPVDEAQAFVLTFVDGRSSAPEIAELSGLPLGRVRSLLGRLVMLGAVELQPADEVAEPELPEPARTRHPFAGSPS
jgi:DNA-directed RNA polymerase specialized sigma24 family protein